MWDLSKDQLISIYNNIKDEIMTEIDPEYYFYLVNYPEKFSLIDALSFEIIHRKSPMYSDMKEVSAVERIGLFANTYLVEKSVVGRQINPFNLYGFPIKFGFGDNTHNMITSGEGNYAADLTYTNSKGNMTITAEVKTFDSSIESIEKCIAKYAFKNTTTRFTYNANYLVIFDRNKKEYFLVARDIPYKHIRVGQQSSVYKILDNDPIGSPEYTRSSIRGFQRSNEYSIDSQEKSLQRSSGAFETDDFIYYKLDLEVDDRFTDVSKIKFNESLCLLAEQIADAIGIDKTEYKSRKNY